MGSLHFVPRTLDLVYRASYLVIPFPPLRPSTSNKFYSFVAYGLKKSTRNDFPPYSTPLLNHLISLDFSRSLRKVTHCQKSIVLKIGDVHGHIPMMAGNMPRDRDVRKIASRRDIYYYRLGFGSSTCKSV
jgi:hypothetical protein